MNKPKNTRPLDWWLIGLLSAWAMLFYRVVDTTVRILHGQLPPLDYTLVQTILNIVILIAMLRTDRKGYDV